MAETTTPTPETSAPPERGASGASKELSFSDVERMLSYNPFPETAPESQPVAQPEQKPEAQPQPPPAPQQTTAQPGSPATPSEAEQLRQQLAERDAIIRRFAQQPAQPQPQTPATKQPDPWAVPDYRYEIPPQLVAAIRSEDPMEAQAAVGALTAGLAKNIHQTAIAQIQRNFQEILPRIVEGLVERRVQQWNITNDFYGTYPELNRPELRALVVSVGQQVAREINAQSWGPRLRDAVAQRVKSMLGQPAQPAPQPPPPPQQPVFQARPAARNGYSPRNDQAAEVQDLLFG